MRLTTTAAMALILLTGCVSTKKYKALEEQLDATTRAMQGKVDERDAHIVSVEKALADEKAKVASLTKKIAGLEADLEKLEGEKKSLETDNSDLNAKLAQMVKDRSRLKGSVEEMRQALADAQKRKAAAEARIAEFNKLLDRFKPLIDTGKLRVKIVDGRMVVELATDVLFASGSAKLSKDGQTAISEVATVLATMGGRKFQIEGHTDNVPIKTAQYPSNWELAAARAITVAKTMIDAGMTPESISAASYGEYKPAADNETKEGKAANRRIEIVLVPDLSTLPGFDELQKMSGGSS